MLSEDIRAHKDAKILQSYWKQLPDKLQDHDVLVEKTVEFCKRQAVLKALIDGAKAASAGNIAEPIRLLEEAAQIGLSNQTGVIVASNEEVEKRIMRRSISSEEAINPMIPDSYKYFLNGGMRKKEVWTWLAGTGFGKSMALVHIGRAALIGHWNVLHYTMEMSDEEIVDRYDAALTGIPLGKLSHQPGRFKNKFLSFRDVVMGSTCQLIVKEFPMNSATVSDFESHMLSLQHKEGFFPDVVIVDYADVLVSDRKYKEPRFEREFVFMELKRISMKHNLLVWTATQGDRKSLSKSVIDLDNTAESMAAPRISTGVLALCQTKKEREQNIARIWIAKNRHRRAKIAIPVRQDLSRVVVCGALPNGHSNQNSKQAGAKTHAKIKRRTI